MATISLCMIVKNEEETLARCLNSIYDLVDEIIIVDTGSSDRTVEIAAPIIPISLERRFCLRQKRILFKGFHGLLHVVGCRRHS